jgi:opacity protein-like surface antigen
MKYGITIVAVVLLLASFAAAQAVVTPPTFETFAGYSRYMANLSATNLLSLKSAVIGGLNGGNASLDFNLGQSKTFGIKADISGYTTSETFKGINVSKNTYLFLVGPQIKKQTGKFHPFGEALFGWARQNVGFTFSGGQNAFATKIGGGIDYQVGKHFFIRPIQADWVLTTFGSGKTNSFSFSTRANNVALGAGLGFTF